MDHGTPDAPVPGVLRLTAPNPSAYTDTGTQTYIVGTRDVAVIDPGPDLPAHLDAMLAAIGERPVTAILCTHTHRDHSPAAAALKAATGASLVGCAALSLEDVGPRADAAFDTAYAPDRVLNDGERVSGTDWALTAIATPGHTSNHLAYALDGTGVLFTGDHVMGFATSVVSPPDGDMGAYMASLELLLGRNDQLYLPGHGPEVTNPQRLVRGMLGHRKQREAQILRLLADGPQPIPAMVERMYAGLDPRLVGAAERSVLAHLIDLKHRGLVAGDEDWDWSIARN